MKKSLFLLMMALLPMAALAQSDDFGVWTSIGVDKKISKKVSVGVEAELRTRDELSTVDRWSFGVDAAYKFSKQLKLSAGYALLHDPNVERISYYDADDDLVLEQEVEVGDAKKRGEFAVTRHRFNVSLTGDVNLGGFNVSLRERWQYTYRPEVTVDERWDYYDEAWDGKTHSYRGKGKNVLRSRLKVEYKFKPIRLTPFVSAELFNAWDVQKVRYAVGTEWKINKQNALEVAYRYQNVRNDDTDFEPNRHILGIAYSYKF